MRGNRGGGMSGKPATVAGISRHGAQALTPARRLVCPAPQAAARVGQCVGQCDAHPHMLAKLPPPTGLAGLALRWRPHSPLTSYEAARMSRGEGRGVVFFGGAAAQRM